MQTKPFLWLNRSAAVLRKDLRIEFRTRYAYSALVMFAVTTLVTVSFSVGSFALENDLAAALLWIILFFSAMAGLSRTFVHEEETGTATALKLAAEPEPVFLGKLLFNVVLLFSLAILVIPLFLVMLNLSVAMLPGFAAVMMLGCMGLAGASTILAAIVSKAGAKGSLLTVLAFPVLLPLLIGAINGTRTTMSGAAPGLLRPDLNLLFFYNGVAIVASLLLFEYVWNE
jgi:heme exporter protein B